MIKAIIIDDEEHCIVNLQEDLRIFCPEVEVAATCHSAKTGILAINSHRPDLVFLDIEMPLMDGFEMLAELEGTRNFEVIFTTAYDQFILRALRLSAIDYLLKPIDHVELSLSVGRVRNEIQKKKSDGQRINNLMKNITLSEEKQKIALPVRNGYDFVEPSEILYCKADGAYTVIVSTSGKSLTLSRTLSETEKLLPSSVFVRIHYSTIINTACIKQIKRGNSYSVLMSNGEEFNVARSKKDAFLSRMGIR